MRKNKKRLSNRLRRDLLQRKKKIDILTRALERGLTKHAEIKEIHRSRQ
jgi:hypothetical protein